MLFVIFCYLIDSRRVEIGCIIGNRSLLKMTGRDIIGIETYYREERLSIIVVHRNFLNFCLP
jgi:hypothetical protein